MMCKVSSMIQITKIGYYRDFTRNQAAESALALWVAMKDSVSQMYDNRGLAEFWGPDV